MHILYAFFSVHRVRSTPQQRRPVEARVGVAGGVGVDGEVLMVCVCVGGVLLIKFGVYSC
jgi:hypothetical protein